MARDSLTQPRISPAALSWFRRYVRVYLRRNFHAVRLAASGVPAGLDGYPLIVVMNHPGWWDPLIALLLSESVFPARSHFGPIEGRALEKYKFFERLGFFGVDPGTSQGTFRFLRTGQAILSTPASALWVTAQGHFADPRQRPVELRPGVGMLVRRLEKVAVLPLALEYSFWEERYPEALARFGEPVLIDQPRSKSAEQWTRLFSGALESTQDRLAADAIPRRADRFDVLLGGRTGVGGMYDLWRALKARVRAERFSSAHGGERL